MYNEVHCGQNCILRSLSNGEHAVTFPAGVYGGETFYECHYDSDLKYQITSGSSVRIHRASVCPDCGGWGPRTVGSIEDHTVTFRLGSGSNEGHTLIADGTPSGRAFDRRRQHNHYGPKREGSGRVEDDGGDRGFYSGPGA